MKPEELYYCLRWGKYKKGLMDYDYIIDVNDSEKIIYFKSQETRSDYDWKINFCFPAKLYKNQKNKFMVARGWGEVWQANKDAVMSELLDKIEAHPGYKVYFCGYSYGGSMAQIACEDYKYRTGKKVDKLITFGSPKPLFGVHSVKLFRECVEDAVQYTCPNDLVTLTVPFPFYFRISTTKVGKKVPFGLFNVVKWHTSYDNTEYYK